MNKALKALILLFAVTFTACDTLLPDDELHAPENTNANTNCASEAMRIEIPRLKDEDVFFPRYTHGNSGDTLTYCVAHNKERRHSRWIAFRFDKSNRHIGWKRDKWKKEGGEPYRTDPELNDSDVLNNNLIWNNGVERFQRGHLLASHDRIYSKEANRQTFYFSNISPMRAEFNSSSPWNNLESHINATSGGIGRKPDFADTLYIAKGGTIEPGYYKQVGSCPTVPNYYFMALLKVKNGAYYSIAFLLPHEGGSSGHFSNYAITVDELEEFTGIDFFCNLNDKLEDAVEKQYNKTAWGL